jgi:hypothetical protein
VNVDVVRVADAPMLATTNFTGTENTDIAITNAVLASLVDQDGSETLTVELNNIPVGHTLTDGTNSFTAAAGAQLVDITHWDVSTLVYTAAAGAFGDFALRPLMWMALPQLQIQPKHWAVSPSPFWSIRMATAFRIQPMLTMTMMAFWMSLKTGIVPPRRKRLYYLVSMKMTQQML